MRKLSVVYISHKWSRLPHQIESGKQPIKQKQCRIMYHFQKDFDKTFKDMLTSSKTRPSTSAWASPLR